MAYLDGLISYYALDESSGNPQDSYGTNHATSNSGTANSSGKINTAYNYNNTYSGIPDSSEWDAIGGAITIAGWFKPDSTGVWHQIITKRDWSGANKVSWGFFFVNTNVLGFNYWAANAHEYRQTTASISAGNWYHVAVTFTPSSSLTLYINGSAVSGSWVAGTGSQAMPSNSTPVGIGAFYDGGSYAAYLKGTVDELGVWDRHLTADEISGLYNGGDGLAYPFGEGAADNINLYLNVGGVWKNVSESYINKNGWKTVAEKYINLGGWKSGAA